MESVSKYSSAADAGDRTVGAGAVEAPGRGGRRALRCGRAVAVPLAELGGRSHAGHGRTHDLQRDDPHRRVDPLAEDLGDARFDVVHRLRVVLGQAAADVVEIGPQRAVGVVVEDEGLGADIDVDSLFHGRVVFGEVYLGSFDILVLQI